MLRFQPLLAIDWIEVIIFLFIVFGSLLGQVYKAIQQDQKRKVRKPGQRAPEPAPLRGPVAPNVGQPPAAGPVAGGGRAKTPIEREIEEFLRRTVGGQPAAEPPKTPPRPPRSRKAEPGRRRPAKQPQRLAEPPAPVPESVAQHVQRHIRSGGVVERDAHLGEQVGQSDERLESRLQQVFEHRLGQLRDGTPATPIEQGTDAAVWSAPEAGQPLAGDLLEMFSTPQKLRTAVVLSEIMRRPEERWS
jgi:hypothetical protein